MSRLTGLTLHGKPHRPHSYNHQGKTVMVAGKVIKQTTVPYTTKQARNVQKRSGQVRAATNNVSRLNVSVRGTGTGGTGDPSYLYKQMIASKEQIGNALTPGQKLPFEKASARLVAAHDLRTGQRPPSIRSQFSSHPYVGFTTNQQAEADLSQHTQVLMSLQRNFNHGGNTEAIAAVTRITQTHPTLGPAAKRTPIQDDGSNLNLHTIHYPSGRDISRVAQHPDRTISGQTQWKREYPKGFTGSRTGRGVHP